MCSPQRSLLCLLALARGGAARADARASLRATSLATARAQVLTPPQILFISSPVEGKVCWAELVNFKATGGRAFPLIDGGLSEPSGIALDRNRGYIYVTDCGARKIYRYKFLVKMKKVDRDDGGAAPEISVHTYGSRLTVAENVRSKWIAVDAFGNVLWTTYGDTKGVYKLELGVIQKLEKGALKLKDIGTVSQTQMAAIASALETWMSAGGNETLKPQTLDPNQIYELYRSSHDASLATDPTGIVADGMNIYWGNGMDAKRHGSLVRGWESPPGRGLGDPYTATALAKNTEHVQGVVNTHNHVVYADSSSKVYSLSPATGQIATLTDKLATPRGVTWDGDNTIFVANEKQGAVWCMPSGRLTNNVPLERVVDLHGAYGLALLGEKDGAFYADAEDADAEEGGARRGAGVLAALVAALMALAAPAA